MIPTGILILNGGLSPRNISTGKAELEGIKFVGKENIRVLIINFASGKDEVVEKVKNGFGKIQGYSFIFSCLDTLVTQDVRNSELHREIDGSDIIYICGGSPVRLMNKLNKRDLFPRILDNYLSDRKVIIGNSAGSVIFFEKFITSVDKVVDGSLQFIPKVRKGYGYIPGLVAAHFSNWSRQEILKNFSNKHKINGIGIDEGVALVTHGIKQYWIVSDETAGYWMYEWRKGELVSGV